MKRKLHNFWWIVCYFLWCIFVCTIYYLYFDVVNVIHRIVSSVGCSFRFPLVLINIFIFQPHFRFFFLCAAFHEFIHISLDLIYHDKTHYWLFRWYYNDDVCAARIWVRICCRFAFLSPSNPFPLCDDFAGLFRYFSVRFFVFTNILRSILAKLYL